jgi:D-methionine transport system substrate-binding protein
MNACVWRRPQAFRCIDCRRRCRRTLEDRTSAGPVGIGLLCRKTRQGEGQDVKIVELGDWVALNEVVNSGDVDANLFQHGTYLALQNKQRGFNLVQSTRSGDRAGRLFSKRSKA